MVRKREREKEISSNEGRATAGGSRGGTGRRDGRPLHLPRESSSPSSIPSAPAAGRRSCVLLLSGGLDSATCLALVSRWGWTVHALSFDYGQRHRVELLAARRLARTYRVASHRVIAIPSLGALGGSALTDRSIRVPKKSLGKTRVPVTYVPARNTLFLAFALGVAETSGATEIVIGANALDYSGYPDCRPAFLARVRARREPRDEGRRRGAALLRPRAASLALEGRDRPARARARARSRPHDVLLRALGLGKALRRVRLVSPQGEGLRRGRRRGSPDALIHRAGVRAASSRARARRSRGGRSRG